MAGIYRPELVGAVTSSRPRMHWDKGLLHSYKTAPTNPKGPMMLTAYGMLVTSKDYLPRFN